MKINTLLTKTVKIAVFYPGFNVKQIKEASQLERSKSPPTKSIFLAILLIKRIKAKVPSSSIPIERTEKVLILSLLGEFC